MREPFEVECLACGCHRRAKGQRPAEVGECPQCGYVGWAPLEALDDRERSVLQWRLNRLPHERDQARAVSLLERPDQATPSLPSGQYVRITGPIRLAPGTAPHVRESHDSPRLSPRKK